jgi:hypothetical protein
MQETARETDAEIKYSSPSMASRDTNMENETKEEEQSMDIEDQEGCSDDDTFHSRQKTAPMENV